MDLTGYDAYSNDPKFSDRYAWANSADPDQTAPRGAVWSGSTLFAILSASFGLITLWLSHIVQTLEWLQQIFLGVRKLRIITVLFGLNGRHQWVFNDNLEIIICSARWF